MNLEPSLAEDSSVGAMSVPGPTRRAILGAAGIGGLSTAAFVRPGWAATQPEQPYLVDPSERFLAFLRASGDVSGKETLAWASGSVFAWLPRRGGFHLFNYQLFTVQRLEKTAKGWFRFSKEAGVYVDKDTGDVMQRWHNPFIGRDVDVIQMKNDPTNIEISEPTPELPPPLAWVLGDTIVFTRDILVTRPAELKVAEYPLNAQSNTYKVAEYYNHVVARRDLENKALTSVPMVGSNTRVGNWYPWLEMGQRRGWLITQLRSKKLARAEQLPPVLYKYWQARDPSIFHAPATVTGPNESSWTYFKKLQEEKRNARAGGPT